MKGSRSLAMKERKRLLRAPKRRKISSPSNSWHSVDSTGIEIGNNVEGDGFYSQPPTLEALQASLSQAATKQKAFLLQSPAYYDELASQPLFPNADISILEAILLSKCYLSRRELPKGQKDQHSFWRLLNMMYKKNLPATNEIEKVCFKYTEFDCSPFSR